MTTHDTPLATHLSIIGIDLGTTNSAMGHVNPETAAGAPNTACSGIRLFSIPQLTAPGEIRNRPVLPSFLYIPGHYDIDRAAIQQPWPTPDDTFAGTLARDHGAHVPARLVSSAKSWLCHGRADRRARILPWGAPAEVSKVSPVQASAAYLSHFRHAWNQATGNEEEHFLENQRIVLTVPASFDEVARELTLEAAALAGLRNVILLEEPLAAFYAWLANTGGTWREAVRPGDLILVCDVGGGTSDFSLIAVSEENGDLALDRVAVGNHLLVGGDNMDLALARTVEANWRGASGSPMGSSGGSAGSTLDADRWKALCHQCRQAKEQILSGAAATCRISLTGTGSRLISGTRTADLDREIVTRVVLEGFFPLIDAAPPSSVSASHRSAISEFGLPYEQEPAITRHLWQFLMRHAPLVEKAVGKSIPLPDHVLFNGGALKPDIIQNRMVDALVHGLDPERRLPRPKILENAHHDTAVALGAAYYGLVKIGRGVRVGSGSPRAYYLGVSREASPDTPDPAETVICLVERGLEEGTPIHLPMDSKDHRFTVLANQPVQFPLYSSSYRSGDRTGDVLSVDDSMVLLPPLQTVVQYGKKDTHTRIPVTLEGEYTELGTLAVRCCSRISDHRWQLHFQLRDRMAAVPEVREETLLDEAVVQEAGSLIRNVFQEGDKTDLETVVKQLTLVSGLHRDEWPLSFLRKLADDLLLLARTRSTSPAHEARWMNLTGFCLRPGFGDVRDEQRIRQLWRLRPQGPVHAGQSRVQTEWWILWRRIAGGLTPGQQRQMSQDLWNLLNPGKDGKIRISLQQQTEAWMAVGNLERLYANDKVKWGDLLLTRLRAGGASKTPLIWTLSRLGAREPLYGPVDRVIPPDAAARWISALLDKNQDPSKPLMGALVRMARKTGDRTRDLGPDVIALLLDRIPDTPENQEMKTALVDVVPVARQEAQAAFGDSLPHGILLQAL
ncbi:hsp70 family protein [Desulfosarcina sp. OttesenSCG-928-B08]|nr:hsp70 family protein [Desulfosarcina sp. OttesenSCG-928-B08]